MEKNKFKNVQKTRRKKRVRKKVSGDAQRPRLTVFRSLRHISAQLIDDEAGCTLVAASTLGEKISSGGNSDAATKVGQVLAKKATELGIRQVSFDRSGFRYHGRVKALAEAAREAGLVF
ncbi:MAG: 50S ribosomal protein L18 [Phycisphaerae bacterium]|nr:50S ribosomal protein L18 [Phycisphaerae bacterium]